MSRNGKDRIAKGFIYGASGITLGLLLFIIGFIIYKGLPGINLHFLTNNYESATTYIEVMPTADKTLSEEEGFLSGLDAAGEVTEDGFEINKLGSNSPLLTAIDRRGNTYKVKKGDVITKIGKYSIVKDTENNNKIEEMEKQLEGKMDSILIKVVRPGGGIIPMLVTTLYMIGLSILIAGPIGILAAIYLNEYGKQGRLLTSIRFAIKNLAGIPSIIYGLFGSIFFVQVCRMKYSLLAGALTVSIILLPVIISTTEETLKAIPRGYRESSFGLGATQLQTIFKVILPNAIPGILTAILLSIGRVAGESAALILTAGTAAKIPEALTGNSASGATLTIKLYTLMKEENDLTTACAIGIVLLVIIIGINMLSKWVTMHLSKKRGI